MLKRLNSKTGRDYVFTFFTEFAVLLAGVLVYKFAKTELGDSGFSQYSICRRTASFIQPLLIIGLGVGIPRYIAFAMHDPSMRKQGSYFVSGVLLISIITIPVLSLLVLFSPFFSNLFFGSPEYATLIPYICMLIFGMVLHGMVYGYFRGKMKMMQANLLQMINLGIVPLLAFYAGKNIEQVLLITGLVVSITSSLLLFWLFFSQEWLAKEIRPCFNELFKYGSQRVPGDVALAGFLALPAYFAAHVIKDDLITAGYIAFGMSLLNMVGAVFGPICLILLPKASEVIVKKDFTLLGVYIQRITWLTLGLTFVGLAVAELFTPQLLDLYLGTTKPELIFCVRIILMAALGYTLYISLRSILDAYYVRAMNTINIFIAFVFFIIVAGVLNFLVLPYQWLLYTFVVAMWILGVLTYIKTSSILRSDADATKF